MDALSDVLQVLRLSGAVFLDANFSAPWCITSKSHGDAEHTVFFHWLIDGSCKAQLVTGGAVFEAAAGDLLLMPHDATHILGSDLTLPPIDSTTLVQPAADSGLARIEHGGGGERARFVCGFLTCDKRLCRPLLEALPGMIRVPLGDDPAAWFRSLMQVGTAESVARRPGSDTVLAKLAELLFVEAIRRYIETLPEGQIGWLAGLRDRYVGRALALMHHSPEQAWTMDMLAHAVGLSRSALAQRFTELVGHPPMQYLTRWRLTVAAQRLRAGHVSLAAVAEHIGYDSAAAFNRAFKREFGLPPATWRKTCAPEGLPQWLKP